MTDDKEPLYDEAFTLRLAQAARFDRDEFHRLATPNAILHLIECMKYAQSNLVSLEQWVAQGKR